MKLDARHLSDRFYRIRNLDPICFPEEPVGGAGVAKLRFKLGMLDKKFSLRTVTKTNARFTEE
jgi:hypothetical protein